MTNIQMHLLLEIRHSILIQCHGNYIEGKKFTFMVLIDIFKKSQNTFSNLGVLKGVTGNKQFFPSPYPIKQLTQVAELL